MSQLTTGLFLRLLASDLNAWSVLKGMMKNMVEIKLGSLLTVKK